MGGSTVILLPGNIGRQDPRVDSAGVLWNDQMSHAYRFFREPADILNASVFSFTSTQCT